VVGRLVPGLRIATTVSAGALGIPYRTFLAGAAIGSNNLPFFLVGFFVGPGVLDVIEVAGGYDSSPPPIRAFGAVHASGGKRASVSIEGSRNDCGGATGDGQASLRRHCRTGRRFQGTKA